MRRVETGSWLLPGTVIPVSQQLDVLIATFRAGDHEWRLPVEELGRGHGFLAFEKSFRLRASDREISEVM